MDVIGKEKINTEKVTFAGKLPTPLDIMVEDVEVPDNVEIGDRIIIYSSRQDAIDIFPLPIAPSPKP